MADHQKYALLFLVLFFCFFNSCYAHLFVIGGRDGWVLNPSENYNHWAQRNRFQVNDTLLFEYKNDSDSLLVVNKNDYDNCNTGNPILKIEDGNSVFKFDRSGPFYFISGNKANCDKGQKLIVVVLAVRNRPELSSPSLPPTTGPPAQANSPSSSGGAPSSASSPSIWSPYPATGASSPAATPWSPYPATGAPSPAATPWSPYPATGAPSPAGMHGSPHPPTGAPSPSGPPGSPSPAAGAPASESPSPGPPPASEAPSLAISGPGPSPVNASPTTRGSPNSSMPRTGTPGDVNSPGSSPRMSLAAPPCTPSILFASLVLSVVFGGFVVSS